MRVLVVQNFINTGLGQIAQALDERGVEPVIVKVFEGEQLPLSADGFVGIIVLGGGQNARDDVAAPWFPQLLGLMRAFVDSERPALGVCLGSQLLARAYGADNLVGATSEFGWCDVDLTEEGRDDPVTGALPTSFPIFQWHDDTFTLPRGGTRLAGNLATHNQAFRVGRAGYGIQFHFEANTKLVREWNETFADELATTRPGWPDRHPVDEARHGARADEAGIALARAWTALLGPAD